MINIYGIYDKRNNVLLYIGSSSREKINDRFLEHKRDLRKNTHSNKTLMKHYIKNELTIDNLEFKVLYHLDLDNSLIKMTLEMMTISLLRPKCDRCSYQTGRAMMTFKRCDDPVLCQNVINVIMGG